ncbi:FAD/NAD-P-binding domain-containing protein [Stereum hirsutum FP-91666 SS1]|uniref:FAD/NAD-P-binding domain-containing protein n=1 Tax=Stereum hirsutum (strain FP-91666) TaxID=721885 RepID=UPI000440F836|nr:FAD/NAD-P-binding domain-containing protein [Stereum hirsutum FP-91666 SS1]EIM91866.1 FAD/NAD-P-binding domain-containing protein [Stereum hirsutum FP-91666 SS1]
MSNTPHKMRVAVCGGGVGGIVAAYALGLCKNIEVNVFEAASKFAEIGAGIGVTWRGWMVLRQLGLEEDLLQLLPASPSEDMVPATHCRKSDQGEGISFMDTMTRGGYTTFLRSEFHGVLMKRLSSRCATFPSKRLVAYEESPHKASEPITLHFEDGSSATCDILIGADGVKSVVRSSMFEALATKEELDGENLRASELRSHIRARWSGVLVLRALIPAEKLRAISPNHRAFTRNLQYLGKDRHLMVYPISQGRLVNVAVFEADYNREGTVYPEPWITTDVDTKAVIESFRGWEPEVQDLIGCMDGLTVNQWAVNVVNGLPSFVDSRVVLLGDAAHAMTPFQGAGAAQAIEDAYVLSNLLSHPGVTRDNAPRALKVYSQIRLPFAYDVLERSRRGGLQYAFHDSQRGSDSSDWDLTRLAKEIQQNSEWASTGHPKDELEHAVALLEKELIGVVTS